MLLLWQCGPTALVIWKKGDSGSSTHGLNTFNPCCSPPKHKDPPCLSLNLHLVWYTKHLTHPSSPNYISSLLYLLFFSYNNIIIKTFPIKLDAALKMSKSTSHKNYNFSLPANVISLFFTGNEKRNKKKKGWTTFQISFERKSRKNPGTVEFISSLLKLSYIDCFSIFVVMLGY